MTRFAITLMLLLVLPGGAAAKTPPAGEELPDSLISARYVYYYSISNPTLARRILDQTRRRGILAQWMADKIEADLNYNNRNYNLAVFFYNRALTDDDIHRDGNMYETTLVSAADAYEKIKDYDHSMDYLRRSVAASEASGDFESLGKAYALLGMILWEQQDRDKAYNYLDMAVETLERSNYRHKYPRIFDLYATIALYKAEDGQWNSALQFIDRMPAIIESAGPSAGLFVENYAATMRKDYFNYRATILHGAGDPAGAYESYLEWRRMDGTASVNDLLILDYLIPSRHWDEAILYCASFDDYIADYPYSHEAQAVAQALATINELRGRHEAALGYNKQLLEIADTIRVREHRSRAIEYATIYETQKKDAELENQRKKTRLWFALCAISVVALAVITVSDRRRRAAYRVLVEKNRRWAEGESAASTAEEDDGCDRGGEPTADEARVMRRVREYVEGGRNYRNPLLGLDVLATELGINRKYISTAINRSTSHNFNAYVNELRVKEAVRLLSERDGRMTIDEISERVGFNNPGSFYEWFKKYTALTPTQFKRNAPTGS
ncbi:MAG: AraC family transcriptional regulator [Alistipes sp.]|jgi:AraC-like DNA-binding protein/tetratricopeptide (TPR) repeat protein|nr:AraC family transcriptional regulator [Alistipes sp.]